MVVQGAVNPDEFYVYKPTLAKGKPAILRRSLGSKQLRMVYSDTPGERVRTEDTPAELRNRFSLSDDDVHELSDRKSVVSRKRVSVSVALCGRRINTKKKNRKLLLTVTTTHTEPMNSH